MKRTVDRDLLQLCTEIIAGLDADISLLFPKKELKRIPKTEIRRILAFLREKALTNSDDFIQNETYYGGLWSDGLYHFSTWKSDYSDRKLDIPLSVRQIKDICCRKLTKVDVKYYSEYRSGFH